MQMTESHSTNKFFQIIDKIYRYPERIFIVLTIVFGLFISMYSSPFDIPDEDTHWLKAYAISSLQPSGIDGSYAYFPVNVAEFQWEVKETGYENINDYYLLDDINVMDNSEAFYSFRTAGSNPLLQLCPAIAIAVTNIFTDSVLILFIAGRIGNLLMYAAIGYFAIKRSPKHQWSMTMIGLLPMSLLLAASYSYDTIIIAMGMLLFSTYLKMKYTDGIVEQKDKIIFIISGAILIIAKMVYAPMVGVLLFVDKDKFRIKFEKFYLMIFTGILGIGLYYLWAKLGHLTNYIFNNDLLALYQTSMGATTMAVPSGASVVSEVISFIKDPVFYIRSFLATMGYYGKMYLPSTVAISFGISISYSTAIKVWITIFIVSIIENLEGKSHPLHYIYNALLFTACIFLTFLALYSYIPPEYSGQYYSDFVRGAGIQGRYFLPCSFLLLPCISIPHVKDEYKRLITLIVFIIFIILIVGILALL